MAYAKNNPAWVAGGAPGISAERLNHIETQYDEAMAESALTFLQKAGGTLSGSTTHDDGALLRKRAIISVVDEGFTSAYDTAVQLDNPNIKSGTVVVTTTDGVTTYTEGADYTINYVGGSITVLSTGTMANTTAYYIDYDHDNTYTIVDDDAHVHRAVYNDLAEFFPTEEEGLEAGDVLVTDGKGGVRRATIRADRRVVGVFSDTFGFILGGKNSTVQGNIEMGFIPVGLAGKVCVRVSGEVEVGDLLIASDVAGVAVASENPQPGAVIGKALEPHSGEDISRIAMVIMLA